MYVCMCVRVRVHECESSARVQECEFMVFIGSIILWFFFWRVPSSTTTGPRLQPRRRSSTGINILMQFCFDFEIYHISYSIKNLLHKAPHSISQWKVVNDSVAISNLFWWKAKIFWLRVRPEGLVLSMLGWDWVPGPGSSWQMWTWRLAGSRNRCCRWRQRSTETGSYSLYLWFRTNLVETK